MNYFIISSQPIVNAVNKSIKNIVTVKNSKSGKEHVGYEYQNGRVDILKTAGMRVVWKTVIQ